VSPVAESEELRRFREAYERYIEIFNAGEFERAFSGVSEDFELHLPAGGPERTVRGREATVRFFRELRATLDDWRIEASEFHQLGPEVFLVGLEASGTGHASGVPTTTRTWEVDETEAGRVARGRQFRDREQALATAAGLVGNDAD